MAENLGAASHSGEPEIGGVGEQRRHQRHAIFGRRSRAQMTESIGEPCPAMHFGEKLGDAQTRQHAIEPPRDILEFIGLDFADRADRKPFGGDDGFGELAGRRERIDFLKSEFEKPDSFRAPIVEDVRRRQAPTRLLLRRAAKVSGGKRKSSKARNARLPSTQMSPDRKRSRSVIMAATS